MGVGHVCLTHQCIPSTSHSSSIKRYCFLTNYVSYSIKSFIPLCNLQTFTNAYSIHSTVLEVSWGQRCMGKVLESLLGHTKDFVFGSRQAGELQRSRNWDPPQSAISVKVQEKCIGRMYWTSRRPMVLYQNLLIYPQTLLHLKNMHNIRLFKFIK